MEVIWLFIREIPIVSLGLIAGALQVLGYVVYIRKSLRRELEPNSAAWLMFAYGTALLTALELDLGASIHLLLLPTICATLSVYVAYICWRRGTLGWPEDSADRFAFIADIMLTIAYLGAWWLSASGSISDEWRGIAVVGFLVLSNLTTLTAFSPLLRDAYLNPHRERSGAWVIWTLAYATLGIATFSEYGLISALMLYPFLNTLLHGSVAWLARSSRRKRHTSFA